ncbi:MFS transporter, partial [Pyxidicoccus sp. 3LG]
PRTGPAVAAGAVDGGEVPRAEGQWGAVGGRRYGLGLVLGPVIGSQLHVLGAWAPPLAGAVLATAALAGVFFLFPETHPHHGKGATRAASDRPKVTLAQALSQPGIAPVLALFFLTFIGMTNLQVSLGLLAQARFGWGEREVGRLFALMGLMTFVLQGFAIGWMTRVAKGTTLVLLGAVLMGTGLACIALAEHPALLVVAMVLVGTGMGMLQPVLASLASALAGPELQGGVLGIVQSSGGLARVVGPVWSGFLYTRLGPGAPFLSGVAAAGICLLVGAALRRHHPEDGAPPSPART